MVRGQTERSQYNESGRIAKQNRIRIGPRVGLALATQTGSLEAGKLADLIVLDRNVLKIPAQENANVKVVHTIIGGKIVYIGISLQRARGSLIY